MNPTAQQRSDVVLALQLTFETPIKNYFRDAYLSGRCPRYPEDGLQPPKSRLTPLTTSQGFARTGFDKCGAHLYGHSRV